MNRARAQSAPLDVPPDLAPHRLVADLLSMRLGGWEARRTAVVHVVQRERGVTCGWVASGGAQFEDKIAAVREATDSARPSPTVAEAVARIRSEADAAVANARSCGGEDAGCELSGVAALAPRFHSVFSDWNALLQQALAAAPDEVALATGEPASPEAPCEASAAAASFDPRAVKAYAAFAHLKEATGIERAFLCGALALPEEALPHLPSRAFADLVIGLQQQRAFEERVRQAASPKLLELIRAGFELKPELQRLQERLRCDFDIAALRATLSADRCWQIMTDHLDKLEHQTPTDLPTSPL